MRAAKPLMVCILLISELVFPKPWIWNSLPVQIGPTQIFLPIVTRLQPSVGGLPGDSPLLLAAGDIGSCTNNGDEATAAIILPKDGTVLALGDNVYDSATFDDFMQCYDPSWGQFKDRTYPIPGNHEYLVPDAAGYFSYFGSAAGDPARGYYSFDQGTWHIVALNSNCAYVGGCHAGSPQEQWLRADLAAHPVKCTLAFWHHPLFSSGKFGAWEGMAPFWQALYDAGAEIVLSGHDHNYERFAPQDAAGKADSRRGIVQYVVGTGGKELTELLTPMANSIVRDNLTYGVLEIRLGTDQYQWSFTPVAGGTFSDSGSGTCH